MNSTYSDPTDTIQTIKKRIYWPPTEKYLTLKINKIAKKLHVSKKQATILVLDYLKDIMLESQAETEAIIQQRINDGTIRNADQARKSVAGINFQSLVAYVLSLNILEKNLPNLKIALKPKKHPLVEKYTTIKIGNETQKPDVDIIIFSDKPRSPIIILSVKTSLRERAGQTYKWKLLLNFATTKCPYIEGNNLCPINKFQIKYEKERDVFVAFVTADFYDELKSPQQRGMFAFFDYAYVANKTTYIKNTNVKYFSEIIADLNDIYTTSS